MDFKSFLLWTKMTLVNPNILRSYLDLKHNERLSSDELAELNWKKRQRLLKYAYEHVPYYRSKYGSAGLNPEDIRFPGQWESVPALTKTELVEHFEEMNAEGVNPRRLRLSTTGGSTGVPVKVFFDKRFPMEPLRWRMFSWWGVGPGENAAFAWRSLGWSRFERLRRYVSFWPTRRLYLDASLISRENLDAFVCQCQRVRPALVQGYVGAIESLAEFILENAVDFPAPKAVWTTASPISKTQRIKIHRAFRAPVYDQYGCGEISQLAAQCAESENLHIFSDTAHIEFLDDSGHAVPSGEKGKIALTDLENLVFPLIRYLNGDEGSSVEGQCKCGISLPLMAAVLGRTTDHLYLPGGGILGGDFLTTVFDSAPDCIKAFQVLQKKDLSIDLRVVVNTAEHDADQRISRVAAMLREKTLGLVEVNIVHTATIGSDRGKTRYVVREQ